jgi:hypothetical protein
MIFAASLVAGPLLFGNVSTEAVARMAGNDAAIHLVGEGDADRSSFTDKAQDDMQRWGQRVHDFGTNVKDQGQQGVDSAKRDLNTAYDKAKVAADGLKTAGQDGWQGAKTTFERARDNLATTWDRIRGQ